MLYEILIQRTETQRYSELFHVEDIENVVFEDPHTAYLNFMRMYGEQMQEAANDSVKANLQGYPGYVSSSYFEDDNYRAGKYGEDEIAFFRITWNSEDELGEWQLHYRGTLKPVEFICEEYEMVE